MKIRITYLALLYALLYAPGIEAQIIGNVSLIGPNDYSGIKVKFYEQSSPYRVDSVFASPNGHFSIDLPEGNYKVFVVKKGFDSVYYNTGESLFLTTVFDLGSIALTEHFVTSSMERLAENFISLTGLIHRGTGILNNGVVYVMNDNDGKTTIGKINSDGTFLVDSTTAGRFYIYAVPDPKLETTYLPTYYIEYLEMNQSNMIQSSGNVSGIDLYMLEKPASENGTALLEGRFSYFQNFGNDDNTDFSKVWFNNTYTPTSPISIFNNPCRNMPVLLYNSSNEIVAFAVTDQEGYYAFKNLAGGTYRIQGQKNRYSTQNGGYLNVTLGGTTQTSFQMISDFMISGLKEDFRLPAKSIIPYPNPFQNKLSLPFQGEITITDLTGTVFLENAFFKGGEIQTDNWPKGVYLVKHSGSVSKILKN